MSDTKVTIPVTIELVHEVNYIPRIYPMWRDSFLDEMSEEQLRNLGISLLNKYLEELDPRLRNLIHIGE